MGSAPTTTSEQIDRLVDGNGGATPEFIQETHRPSDGPLDKAGRPFDPSIHSHNPDGSPIITPSGFLRRRRGSSGPASKYVPPQMGESYRSLGIAVAETLMTVCQMAGGENWKPADAEREALHTAWAQYFEQRGIDYVPPEIMLATVMAGYVMPRMQHTGILERIRNKLRRKSSDAVSVNNGNAA